MHGSTCKPGLLWLASWHKRGCVILGILLVTPGQLHWGPLTPWTPCEREQRLVYLQHASDVFSVIIQKCARLSQPVRIFEKLARWTRRQAGIGAATLHRHEQLFQASWPCEDPDNLELQMLGGDRRCVQVREWLLQNGLSHGRFPQDAGQALTVVVADEIVEKLMNRDCHSLLLRASWVWKWMAGTDVELQRCSLFHQWLGLQQLGFDRQRVATTCQHLCRLLSPFCAKLQISSVKSCQRILQRSEHLQRVR